MNKQEALKEKFKIALTSTIKVISEKDKVEVNFEGPTEEVFRGEWPLEQLGFRGEY